MKCCLTYMMPSCLCPLGWIVRVVNTSANFVRFRDSKLAARSNRVSVDFDSIQPSFMPLVSNSTFPNAYMPATTWYTRHLSVEWNPRWSNALSKFSGIVHSAFSKSGWKYKIIHLEFVIIYKQVLNVFINLTKSIPASFFICFGKFLM